MFTLSTPIELIHQVNSVLATGQNQTLSFTDRGTFHKPSESIQKEAAALAYSVLGTIASLEARVEDLESNYHQALRLAPGSRFIKQAYLTCLQNMGLFSKALYRTKELLPGDLHWLTANALYCCKLTEALHYLNQMEDTSDFPYSKVIEQGAWTFQTAGLSDEEASKLQAVVYHVLHRHGIYAVRPHLAFFESVNLIYQIGIDVSIEEIVVLNFEMAEDLCHLEKMWENVIVFEYTSWHKGGELQ